MVYQLAYSSFGKSAVSPERLNDILVQSNRNNAADGITGLLMHGRRQFFQVLEGERHAVDALLERLLKDPRHTSVTLLHEAEVGQRTFSDWSMGFAGPEAVPGISGRVLVSLAELKHRYAARPKRDRFALTLAQSILADLRTGPALS
jgi:hypothetical protein